MTCELGEEKCYSVYILEIGTDNDNVHFLVQSVPTQSPTQLIIMLKSITAREIIKKHPEVKKQICRGAFWTDGFNVSTEGKHGNEDPIFEYVREQGIEKEYNTLH